MTNDDSTNPLKKQMQKEAEAEPKETKKMNIYTLSFNINNAVGDTIVVGAPTITKALEKFIAQYGGNSNEWNSIAINVNETVIL